MPENDCDVLVVGAGPTGLMAANLLRRSGVAVRIVDQLAHASRESRAFAIVARSMELFGQLGLVDQILDRGVIAPGIDLFVAGKPVGGLNYDRAESLDTPYPFLTLHPQAYTEAVLIADLARLGVQVERQVSVTDLLQDAQGVTTHARLAQGVEATIRSAYVIGADGAHSIVRRALGLSFQGAKYAQTFMLADCRVQWPSDSSFDHGRFRVFMRGDTIALFLPMDGQTCSRVMVTDHSNKVDVAGAGGTALDLAELEVAYRQATGLNVQLTDPVWTTRYRVNHRGVPCYSVGRAFVAGDAAHIHSPAGGQGMNTGLQDAANLAWKIAAVLRRGAPSTLLDTYDTERLPVGRQVVATSDKMFSAAAGKTGWEATVRDWLAKPAVAAMSRIDAVQRTAFRKLSQLEIHYPHGPFIVDGAPVLGDAGPQVGWRAPNARIDRYKDVFELIRGFGFSVLAFSRKPLERDERVRLFKELDAIADEDVRVHLIARTSVGRDARTVMPTDPAVFETYGLHERERQGMYIIRPDGYIAWRCAGLDVHAARAFLDRFGKGKQTTPELGMIQG